jgi:microcompartment protein CcmL/EutN
MKKYPAVCIIETTSVSSGLQCTDAMLKKSPVTILKSGTVHPGKFLTLLGGSVASVEEAYQIGLRLAAENMRDHVFLPDIHESVMDTILGARTHCSEEAIGVFETKTLCATVKAADKAVKGMKIDLVELRYSDDLGGRAFVIYTGRIEEVNAALDISVQSMENVKNFYQKTLIPRPDENLCMQLNHSSIFDVNPVLSLADGEL